MKHIYSVEIEVHYEGISRYYLFSSPKKALDFAEGYMSERSFKELAADSVAVDVEDVLRVWEGSGQDVVIRRKPLMD